VKPIEIGIPKVDSEIEQKDHADVPAVNLERVPADITKGSQQAPFFQGEVPADVENHDAPHGKVEQTQGSEVLQPGEMFKELTLVRQCQPAMPPGEQENHHRHCQVEQSALQKGRDLHAMVFSQTQKEAGGKEQPPGHGIKDRPVHGDDAVDQNLSAIKEMQLGCRPHRQGEEERSDVPPRVRCAQEENSPQDKNDIKREQIGANRRIE